MNERPLIAGVLGALVIAFSGILVRLAEVSPSTAAVFRCAYALPVLGVLAAIERRRYGPLARHDRLLAVGAGLFFAADLTFWHHSIEAVGAGLATVIANAQVVLVGLLAWAALGERPAGRSLASIPVVFAGVVLISGAIGAGAYGDDPALGVVYGVLTAITYALFLLILRQGNSDIRRPAGPLFDATASGAFFSVLGGLAVGDLDWVPDLEAQAWLVLLALSSQVVGWLLISVSLPRLPALVTSIVLMLQPVSTVFLAALLLSEAPSLGSARGGRDRDRRGGGGHGRPPRRGGARVRRIVPALGAAGAAALGYRTLWSEPRRVEMTRLALDLPRWPAELSGLRVGVISDLHAGAPHVPVAQVTRLVERMNAEAPDLIALLGDYASHRVIGGKRIPPEPVAESLGGLRAPLGVYAVLGNHDWWVHGHRMGAALRAAGINVLENEAVRAGDLWVAGLADLREREPSIGRTFDPIPEGDAGARPESRPRPLPLPARAGGAHALRAHPRQPDQHPGARPPRHPLPLRHALRGRARGGGGTAPLREPRGGHQHDPRALPGGTRGVRSGAAGGQPALSRRPRTSGRLTPCR